MPACVETIAPSSAKHLRSKLLGQLELAELPGIDAASKRVLRQRGVVRVEQLRRLPKPVLVAAFGDSVGRQLWAAARGLDEPNRTFWSRMRAGLARIRQWLASSPKPAKPAFPTIISSPDTA
jgi:hypothetical protein